MNDESAFYLLHEYMDLLIEEHHIRTRVLMQTCQI